MIESAQSISLRKRDEDMGRFLRDDAAGVGPPPDRGAGPGFHPAIHQRGKRHPEHFYRKEERRPELCARRLDTGLLRSVAWIQHRQRLV